MFNINAKEIPPMKQSFYLKTLVLLFALIIQSPISGQTAKTGATATPDHVALTWTGSPETTIIITWRTDASVTEGFVQFEKGDKLTRKARQAKAEPRSFDTDLGATRLFTATLINLSPGSKYSYRVGNGDHWSEPRVFSTAKRKTNAFKFLIFSDSQSDMSREPYGIWRKTVQNAFAANPDAKFLIGIGDLVDYGQSGAQWNAWFDGAKGVIDRIPLMPATGNHEFYGAENAARPLYWLLQWVVPQNGPEGLKSQAYSYDYGPVHFVALDSQSQEQKARGDILKLQEPWLEADLAASKATWKIVYFHKPAYEAYPKRTNGDVKSAFCPIMEKYKVDLVFTAHDHAIARTFPMKNDAAMKKPSEGTIYYISGQSGGKSYSSDRKMDWNTFFYLPQDQSNYFVVEVKGKKIRVVATKQDGTVIDDFFIDKEKDVSSDTLTKPETAPLKQEKPAA
jgi:acid phosphatase type 7